MRQRETVRMGKWNRQAKRLRRKKRVIHLVVIIVLFLVVKNSVNIVSRLSLGAGIFSGNNSSDDFSGDNSLSNFLGNNSSGYFSEGVYPDSLIELAKKNPEAEQFVKDYPDKKDDNGKIDVSSDLTEGIPLFLQWDERWGYRQYGGDFMAVNGCGPTCLAMVWCGLNSDGKWNPYKVASMAEEEGYYVPGQGTSWDLMTNGAAELGLHAESVTFDETHILDTLQRGKPIICVMGPGDFTTQGHFLVLTGVDSAGKIQLNDPNSKKRSGQGWELSRLMSQIRNLWAYTV